MCVCVCACVLCEHVYYVYNYVNDCVVLSRKDGSPEMISPPGLLDSEIVGPSLREPSPTQNR